MKKFMLFATVVAMMVVAMPANAQSRKEKKAAEKAKWEMDQKHQREEAELRHAMRMDSIAKANKVAEEKAAKEEQERIAAEEAAKAQKAKDEAAARAQQKKLEEAAGLIGTEVDEPCAEEEYPSTEDLFRGHGIGEHPKQQLSVNAARAAALEELASQISTKIQALFRIEDQTWNQDDDYTYAEQMKHEVETAVKQETGYNVACRKSEEYTLKGKRMFKTYMIVEISAERVLKAAYNVLKKDDRYRIKASFEEFHEDFKEHFNEL